MEVHLIERRIFNKQNDAITNTWETGYWRFTEEQAKSFERAHIYLHSAQAAPSHMGGIIRRYSMVETGEWAGRVIFYFTKSDDYTGVITDPEGWNRWHKIVPD
jgi:hypothetical protein